MVRRYDTREKGQGDASPGAIFQYESPSLNYIIQYGHICIIKPTCKSSYLVFIQFPYLSEYCIFYET